VVGSSYRAVGTARGLLEGRIAFLLATTAIASFSGGQVLYLAERGAEEGVGGLGDALWWSTNLALTGNAVFEPVTWTGRLLALVLGTYAVVVFASVAAALGAFFVESRAERAAAEEDEAAG
jgi:voltage-gated potassium channel